MFSSHGQALVSLMSLISLTGIRNSVNASNQTYTCTALSQGLMEIASHTEIVDYTSECGSVRCPMLLQVPFPLGLVIFTMVTVAVLVYHYQYY